MKAFRKDLFTKAFELNLLLKVLHRKDIHISCLRFLSMFIDEYAIQMVGFLMKLNRIKKVLPQISSYVRIPSVHKSTVLL